MQPLDAAHRRLLAHADTSSHTALAGEVWERGLSRTGRRTRTRAITRAVLELAVLAAFAAMLATLWVCVST